MRTRTWFVWFALIFALFAAVPMFAQEATAESPPISEVDTGGDSAQEVVVVRETDYTLVYLLVVVIGIGGVVALRLLNAALKQNTELAGKLQNASPPWLDEMFRSAIEEQLLVRGDALVDAIPGEADDEFWEKLRGEVQKTMNLTLGERIEAQNTGSRAPSYDESLDMSRNPSNMSVDKP